MGEMDCFYQNNWGSYILTSKDFGLEILYRTNNWGAPMFLSVCFVLCIWQFVVNLFPFELKKKKKQNKKTSQKRKRLFWEHGSEGIFFLHFCIRTICYVCVLWRKTWKLYFQLNSSRFPKLSFFTAIKTTPWWLSLETSIRLNWEVCLEHTN